MASCLPVTLFSLLLATHLSTALAWKYSGSDGPDNWPGICTTGTHQSPIDIKTARVKLLQTDDLALNNYNAVGDLVVANDGHTVSFWGFDKWEKAPSLSGGGLKYDYDLAQFHFHWAEKDTSGSEHLIGHLHYPIELHLVHVKRGLTLQEAIKLQDGLAVLGVFFDVEGEIMDGNAKTGKEAEGLRVLEPALKATYKPHTKVTVHNYTLFDTLPKVNISKWFYRYEGSLTTPGCQEAVIWTLLPAPIPITPMQLSLFRDHQNEHGELILFNNRPAQPLNGRHVYLRQPRVEGKKENEQIQQQPDSAAVAKISAVLLVAATFTTLL